MATAAVRYVTFLAFLLATHSFSANASFDLPLIFPFSEAVVQNWIVCVIVCLVFCVLVGNNTCDETLCGKGNCTASNSSLTGYECECDRGWTQSRSKDDQLFKFLPCIIPNCSLHLKCGNAPAPANQNKPNLSFTDPCFWTDCGGGLCNNTSLFAHTCECYEGYRNLFNSSAFPCYKQCAFEVECSDLGITIPKELRPPPPPPPSPSNIAIRLSKRVEFGWLISTVTTLALLILLYI